MALQIGFHVVTSDSLSMLCVHLQPCVGMPLATGVNVVVTKSPGHKTGLCHTGHRRKQSEELLFVFSVLFLVN